MSFTGNSFTDKQATSSAYTASTSAPEASQAPSATPAANASTQAPTAAPGLDLVDGIAGILFAPGRAVMSIVGAPSTKDLPMIIGISAVFWWAAYKWVWPMITESFEEPKGSSTPKKKRHSQVEDED